MKTVAKEAIRYAAVSLCALTIDIAVLFILVHSFRWWYILAATASFLIGLLATYLLSVTWVFKYRRVEDPSSEFASFAGIGVVGVAINAAVISFGVNVLGMHYLFAKCGAAGFTFVWNFVARRHFLFVQRNAV
jgi:putative flippase GtrA